MNPDPLIAEIDRRRRERGWTQRELSRTAAIQHATYGHLINGDNGCTVHTLRALAAAVDLDLVLVPTKPPRALQPHGTRAAAGRHQYRGEMLCPECLAWDAARQRARTAAAS